MGLEGAKSYIAILLEHGASVDCVDCQVRGVARAPLTHPRAPLPRALRLYPRALRPPRPPSARR